MLETLPQAYHQEQLHTSEIQSSLIDIFQNGATFIQNHEDYKKMAVFLIPRVVWVHYEFANLTLRPDIQIGVELTETGPRYTPSEAIFNIIYSNDSYAESYKIKKNGKVYMATNWGFFKPLPYEDIEKRIPLLQYVSHDILRSNELMADKQGEGAYTQGFMDGKRDMVFKSHDLNAYLQNFPTSLDKLVNPADKAERKLYKANALQARGYMDARTNQDLRSAK